MRISDWSSDVCSSDLRRADQRRHPIGARRAAGGRITEHLDAVAARLALLINAADQDTEGLGRILPAHHARKLRSEEHTSELQSLMRISYAVFCLKKKIQIKANKPNTKYT